MQLNFLKGKSNSIWLNNKPFIILVLLQILFLSIIKIIFYNYNYSLLFSEKASSINYRIKLDLIGWSLLYDCAIIFFINFLFLVLLQGSALLKQTIFKKCILCIFFCLNTLVIITNVIDIFYFKFHFQRLNADAQFVIDYLFQSFIQQPFIVIIFLILLFVLLSIATFKMIQTFYKTFNQGNTGILSSLLLVISLILILVNKKTILKKCLPSYPLVSITNKQLPIVQNSFHTLIYSLYREGQYLPVKQYFSSEVCDSIFSITHYADTSVNTAKKNIVLFIMESVPYDFFDTGNKYKVKMPFFDSLIEKSNFYTNAYGYAFESNKGIVSVLAGEPTLTEIPLYHSPYVNMPITPLGKVLTKIIVIISNTKKGIIPIFG